MHVRGSSLLSAKPRPQSIKCHHRFSPSPHHPARTKRQGEPREPRPDSINSIQFLPSLHGRDCLISPKCGAVNRNRAEGTAYRVITGIRQGGDRESPRSGDDRPRPCPFPCPTRAEPRERPALLQHFCSLREDPEPEYEASSLHPLAHMLQATFRPRTSRKRSPTRAWLIGAQCQLFLLAVEPPPPPSSRNPKHREYRLTSADHPLRTEHQGKEFIRTSGTFSTERFLLSELGVFPFPIRPIRSTHVSSKISSRAIPRPGADRLEPRWTRGHGREPPLYLRERLPARLLRHAHPALTRKTPSGIHLHAGSVDKTPKSPRNRGVVSPPVAVVQPLQILGPLRERHRSTAIGALALGTGFGTGTRSSFRASLQT